MSIREILKNLCNDADEYAKRSIDGLRLSLAESLSLLYGDIACAFVLFMLLFLAFVFVLVAMVALLVPFTGLAVALMIAVGVLVAVALAVFLLKRMLFVDVAVRRICRIFFAKENEEE